ncbi:hypothetical protein J3E68DRAFT_400057 [Trichoderma sp. SZMC 28012]
MYGVRGMTQDNWWPDVCFSVLAMKILIMLVEVFLLLLPWILSFSFSLLVFSAPRSGNLKREKDSPAICNLQCLCIYVVGVIHKYHLANWAVLRR